MILMFGFRLLTSLTGESPLSPYAIQLFPQIVILPVVLALALTVKFPMEAVTGLLGTIVGFFFGGAQHGSTSHHAARPWSRNERKLATNQLVPISSPLPALVAAAGKRASVRFLEFFADDIRNPHARRAYGRAAGEFLTWCDVAGVPSIAAVQPLHVATGSRPGRARLPHRASSNASRRSATCSSGLSPAKWCRSVRPARCAGPGTS
jgi:hypothetical protein